MMPCFICLKWSTYYRVTLINAQCMYEYAKYHFSVFLIIEVTWVTPNSNMKETYYVKTKSSSWSSAPKATFDAFSSFTKLYLTFCYPMDCSTPGFPPLHYLLEDTKNCYLGIRWIMIKSQLTFDIQLSGIIFKSKIIGVQKIRFSLILLISLISLTSSSLGKILTLPS